MTVRSCSPTRTAASDRIEQRTGGSFKRFVRTARRYRTIDVHVSWHVMPAEQKLLPELRNARAV